MLTGLAGGILFLLLNYSLLEKLIIPDPCYYHNHQGKTNWLFNLFYSLKAVDGYHPSPTRLNFYLTFVCGFSAALFLYLALEKRKKQAQATTKIPRGNDPA
jgi:hypothetical protein